MKETLIIWKLSKVFRKARGSVSRLTCWSAGLRDALHPSLWMDVEIWENLLSFVANFCGCWPVWTESCYSSSFTAPPPYITLRDWTVHNSVLKLGLACWQWCFTHIWSFMCLLKLWNSVTFQLCSQSISKVSLIVFFFSKLYRRVGFPSIFDLKLIAL